MSDIVVTVPKTFRYAGKTGLAAWLDEGDAPGQEWEGEYWNFGTWGAQPRITAGERVYVACEGRIVGYAPLVAMFFNGECVESHCADFGIASVFRPGNGRIELLRAGGAVALTIDQPVIGFRGWRHRWWEYGAEKPLDLSPWLPREVRT